MIHFHHSSKPWTLFLDRDGVLNEEIHDGYVNEWMEFKFYPDTLEALQSLSHCFNRIVVVTNQRGLGKGITKPASLETIHQNMTHEIVQHGGRLDKIYFCPDIDTNSYDRKPNPGMGMKAKADYPEIDFKRSIMVGNNLSDMLFGKNLGMYTVFITSTNPEMTSEHPDIDLLFPNLSSFSQWVLSNMC
jgi:histidinol-phosphate phosphatase family protein